MTAITSFAAMPPATAPKDAVNGEWVEVLSHLDPRYGGLTTAVPALSRSLQQGQGGMQVKVSLSAFCAPDENCEDAGASLPCNCWPLGRGAWLMDRMLGGVLRGEYFASLRGAAGLHLHGLWEQSTALGADAARALHLPYVLSAHGMLEPWALKQRAWKKRAYAAFCERANVAGAVCLHALTRAEASQYVEFGARAPIAVIPNAVEVPIVRDAQPFWAKFAELEGRRVVLFMARLHPKKGVGLLLEAWASVAVQFPQAHLVIAGPDEAGERTRLETMVTQRGLHGSVCFAGMLRGDMKWSALAAAEVFVLPSYSEGLSVAVLEAMAMGLPVIVTHACNMPEVAEHGAGLLVDASAAEVAVALRQLLDRTPFDNGAMGACGEALIRDRFSWPVVARQMAEVYRWAEGGPLPQTLELQIPN